MCIGFVRLLSNSKNHKCKGMAPSSTPPVTILALSVIVLIHVCSGDGEPSNGLGDRINWMSLEEGYRVAKEEGKPLMLIIHKSWCGACKSLKPRIAESDEILEQSKNFVMVNTMDDDEPRADDNRYTPDGGYIPRILFFDPDGQLLQHEINEGGNDRYKYYYYDDESVEQSMARVHASVSAMRKKYVVEKDDTVGKTEL